MDNRFKFQLIQKHDTMQRVYDEPERNLQSAYEVAFYHEYGTLPDDNVIIERVEQVGDSLMFVHFDPEQQH